MAKKKSRPLIVTLPSERDVRDGGTLQPVGAALDRWAWERLCDARPDLAEAVAAAVAGGLEPRVIRRFVSDRTRRPELSNWVEQAARWLAAEGDECGV